MDHQILYLVLVLFLLVAIVSVIAERTRLPSPILMILVGAALAFIPGVPAIRLDPDIVLLVLLPPLLYSSGVGMSWRGFRSALRPILLLAVGCVLFTAAAVALVMHELSDIPWATGFLLGAIVSPPDAVSAVAVLRSIQLPRRVVTVLEGESLANDATALVILGLALQALTTGRFSLVDASLRFIAIAFGEVAFGIALGWLALRARRLARAPRSEVLLALATPFLAFWPPHAIGGSGVIACAAAGLYVSWNGRRLIRPDTRLQGYFIWDLVVWATESIVFLLGGFQARLVAEAVASIGWAQALAVGSVVALTVVFVRFAWVFPATYLPRLIPAVQRSEPKANWRFAFFVAFAGIRGVDSLAAALLVPEFVNGRAFPDRNLILFGTFMVIGVTLICLGGSLPRVVRALGLLRLGQQEAEANKRDEYQVRLQGIDAVLEFLRGAAGKRGDPVNWLSRYYHERRRALSGSTRNTTDEDPIAAAARLERQLVKLERNSVGFAYEENRLTDEARRRVERELDLEEARIASREANSARLD
jgi:Na+/H+ antiporter